MSRWLVLVATLSVYSGCATTEELLANREWRAARERARRRLGTDAETLARWMRSEVRLMASGSATRAESANLDADVDTSGVTLPVDVSLTVEVDPGVLRAVGHYRLAVRHDGLLWMPSHTSATAWQRARSLWALFGDRDRPWPEVPVGYFPRALVCSNFAARGDGDPPFGPDRCEELFMLIPRRSSPGPDMLIVTALIQWPDARADPGTWKRLVFATPLPAGTSLAERITAALGTTPHPLAAVGPEIYE